MSKLTAALAWARRGFPVFPLQENSKLPLAGLLHADVATTDEAQIRQWWTAPVSGFELDYNIGISTNNYVVCDVDTKHEKQGLKTAAALSLDWDTLVVRTPSGGYHLYYQSPGSPVGQSPLGPGIDVRAWHGYVLAPGSTIDGVPYRIEADDAPAPLPAHLRDRFRAPRERAPNATTDIEEDAPGAVEQAALLLRGAENAPQGSRGITCYRVACLLRERGLTRLSAIEALLEHWNERNDPPMDVDDLRVAVEHAYRYAQSAAGSAAPALAFAEVQAVEAPAHVYPMQTAAGAYGLGNLLAEAAIAPRPWLLGRWLLRRELTALIAAPGGGKSLFSLMLACHGAVGTPFAGQHWPDGPVKSIVYDAEDSIAELSRRVHAICKVCNLDVEQVKRNVNLSGSEETALLITKGSPPVINYEKVKELIDRAVEQGVSFIAIGPLADIHEGNENDPQEMNFTLSSLAFVAKETNAAVMITHHTAKPPLVSSASWSGSQYAGRGSSAIPGKARIVLTMFPASAEDVMEFGIPAMKKSEYVKLDGAKSSYSKRPPAAFFHWETAVLNSGDDVGVLKFTVTEEMKRSSRECIAASLLAEMRRLGGGTLTFEQAIAVLKREGAVGPKTPIAEMRSHIHRLVGEDLIAEGRKIVIVTQGAKAHIAVA